MLFDDNDYYDHIFGPDDNSNDFNFNFDDFISNEPINDNIDTIPDDTTPEIDSIPQNPLPPPQNSDSVAYYFEDYTQLKEYVKLYYNKVRNHYILLPVDAIGAIRVDRRRRSYSNYLIPPSCILLPHP